MDKENGKGNNDSSSTSSKLSNAQDQASLLDAASLFGAYWPRGDANSAQAANLFAAAAAGGFGLPQHPSLPFGMLPPASTGRSGSSAAMSSSYSTPSSSSAASSAAAAAAYNNAYQNTLSVAASQAASLGMPAASAAWWSMASHLAAQDYLARLQASGLNFPALGNPADLQYSALGLQAHLSGSSASSGHHKSSSKSAKSASSRSSSGSNNIHSSSGTSSMKEKKYSSSDMLHHQQSKLNANIAALTAMGNAAAAAASNKSSSNKYGTSSSSLTIQPAHKAATSTSNYSSTSTTMSMKKQMSDSTNNMLLVNSNNSYNHNKYLTDSNSKSGTFLNKSDGYNKSSNSNNNRTLPSSPSPSIYNNSPMLGGHHQAMSNSNNNSSTVDYSKSTATSNTASVSNANTNINNSGGVTASANSTSSTSGDSTNGNNAHQSDNRYNNNGSSNSIAGLPSSILSDPNSILGGVRLPPDTEIIKYTSSIVGPKIPGTTNRGRKKTISLDPPHVSVHPAHSSTGLLIERTLKRSKLSDNESSPPSTPSDRVEVIKLPATNGSPSSYSESASEAPLNLSLKPNTSVATTGSSSSLNSLSNMSANIGMDRISRRKPVPKPRRVIPTHQQSPSPQPSPSQHLPPVSASLNQLFATADSPRPPSRNEGSDGGSSTSSTSATAAMSTAGPTVASLSSLHNHKEGRPRNLGRGVSKPKKNTVASLLAQSRALGIKPVPMLDPNASMNQQMNMLKSNILAAQQYISEAGGDEKALNKFLQERFKGALSDSSTVDASDSDNLTDSNYTDSEMEADIGYGGMNTATPTSSSSLTSMSCAKKQKQFDERLLRVALDKGWKRETIIRGLTKNGGIKGDVTYSAPESTNKFKQMSDITQYLDYQKNNDLTRENFTFSCRVIMGEYLQPVPPEMQTDNNEFIHLSEEDVTRRLEELRAAMRTNLPVEQRIEMARKQQAARAAARLDREQQRINKEIERSERQEAARREKEARSQQMLEAKRKRQEELDKQKQEEQQRKQQERELKRQQAALIKEQERERRRQHMALVKAMESRRKLEERERKKQQALAEKLANKEKKLEQRKAEMEILTEIRKPCEDLELDQTPLPEYDRIPGLKLPGKAFADVLMVFEFLHNFGETLGFDMESLPTLDALQQALVSSEHSSDAEEELFSVMTHLLVCAIEDPGIPNPARHTTILGQSLRQADITHANLSEILRIYMYANATGEVKALTGVHFERDREKRIADHHQNDLEMQQTQSGKNSQYYELLHENPTYKMSEWLRDKPFMGLCPTDKCAILAFICNELLQNKAVIRQIEGSLESVAQQKKEKWLMDMKIRKLKMMHSRKLRLEAVERSHNKDLIEDVAVVDSPTLHHKDDLLDDEDNDMSENESVGTQPEEEEDNKLNAEELGKKLEKLLKTAEIQQQSLNTAMLQLRATNFGEDRFFRRYWSLPKGGGVFVEAMESAEPEELENQKICEQNEVVTSGIKSLNELHSVMESVDKINDLSTDREVNSIVGRHHSDEDGLGTITTMKARCDDVEETDNEHRKTPNRLGVLENGEILDKNERNLAELKKSVDDIVQNLERNIEMEKEKKLQAESQQLSNCINNSGSIEVGSIVKIEKRDMDDESIANKKFNLFERLGQCMERENKSEEDLKADVKAEVKEELKNEILNELKCEIKAEVKSEVKMETDDENEHKWFSILNKDGITCDEVHLTFGNKWDNGNVGACTKDITELKIPVFPPPGGSNMSTTSSSTINYHAGCESPVPLQMTAEESAQLDYIKKHGMPKACTKMLVPPDKRYGWWRIKSTETLREVLQNLHVRGARERELKRGFSLVMQTMYDRLSLGMLVVEEGSKDLTELDVENMDDVIYTDGGAPQPDEIGAWSRGIAHRVDMFLLEQVEALEDKVASASMQVKGWKLPSRDETREIPYGQVVSIVKERLTSLEVNIERRYLKPPLGVNAGDPNLAAMTHEASSSTAPPTATVIAPSTASSSSSTASSSATSHHHSGNDDNIPKGLGVWREAVHRAFTSAQLAMCLYSLEASIAWDKSIMKAVSSQQNNTVVFNIQRARKYNSKLSNCQFCQSGDNEDKLLLCDSCDRGYHTYCFKPKMDKIPEGDWYCHECMNKATGERNCIVCGKKLALTGTRMVVCDLCPRAYHTDCIQPQLNKVPRGKWYCVNCISKKPQKRPVKKNHNKNVVARESESSDHPPSSPAPSHSSVTTNEDQLMPVNCSQSDISNSSLINVGSPSTAVVTPTVPIAPMSAAPKECKKERSNKKLIKEFAPCRAILEDLECHDDAWPFLLPVNTKQFPTYKKIIKIPMDLSTIKKRLQDMQYKSRDDFCADVRQIFNNCETFNEDDSPVGKAGHCMRQFFEAKWNELCAPSSTHS